MRGKVVMKNVSSAVAILLGIVGATMVKAETPAKISSRVTAELTRNDTIAVWIYLADKDPLNSGLGRVALNEEWISARARTRRLLRAAEVISEDDRPIDPGAVAALEQAGVVIRTVSRWFTAVSGEVDQHTLNRLADVPWVDSIRIVQTYRRTIPPIDEEEFHRPQVSEPVIEYGPSLTQVSMIRVNDAHHMGYLGHDVLIGFIDSGFDVDHPAFNHLTVLGTRDFINGDDDVGDDDLSQMDHGTKVWSVCGSWVPEILIGTAPYADYALAKTEIREGPDVKVEEDYFVFALQWFDLLGVDIASASVGYPDFYTYGDLDGQTAKVTQGVNRAAEKGMVVIAAAGNEGNNKSYPWIIPPSDAEGALAIGALNPDGSRSSFSSIGPTADRRIKPDVMAMGRSVQVAIAQGDFGTSQGTSFAAPAVAGACALMLQKEPGLTPMDVYDRLRETASLANDPDSLRGYGTVNLAEAMDLDEIVGTESVVAAPNPFFDAVRFTLPQQTIGASVVMRVFDVSADEVYYRKTSGQVIDWEGVNSDGKKLAGGVYVCLFEVDGAYYQTKVALLRR